MRRTALGVLLLASITIAACTSAPSNTATQAPSPVVQSPRSASPTRSPLWPRHPPVVGTIRAIEPPADDILLPRFKSIFLAAYAKACSDLSSVRSAIFPLGPRSRLIDIRCGEEPVRAVRRIFTGVAVPDLRGMHAMNEPQTVLAMLGLRWHIERAAAKAREQPGSLVKQDPPAGNIVPFGTTIIAVIAKSPAAKPGHLSTAIDRRSDGSGHRSSGRRHPVPSSARM